VSQTAQKLTAKICQVSATEGVNGCPQKSA
jgi:hypothetical protein